MVSQDDRGSWGGWAQGKPAWVGCEALHCLSLDHFRRRWNSPMLQLLTHSLPIFWERKAIRKTRNANVWYFAELGAGTFFFSMWLSDVIIWSFFGTLSKLLEMELLASGLCQKAKIHDLSLGLLSDPWGCYLWTDTVKNTTPRKDQYTGEFPEATRLFQI